MSSISSPSASQPGAIQRPPHPHSEKGRLTSAISSGVAGGTISGTDATALTSALDAIDASLSSDTTSAASGGTSTSGARLDPSKIKDRIDGLIAGQVSSGSLTSDQASELKGLFAGGGHGTRGSHGTGEGGPPPGPPPSDAAASGDPSDGSAASARSSGAAAGTAASASASASATDLLASFIQQLQSSQAGTYAASGTSGAGSRASALLFDFQS